MIVGAAGNQAQTPLDHALAHCGAVLNHVVDVGLELGLQSLAEGNGLAGDDVLQGAALSTGEHCGVDLLGDCLVVGEDQAAARTAQGLVSGGGDHVCVRNGRRMCARCNKAGDVGHVDHQVSAHLVGDLAHALEVDHAGIGGGAADDQLRLLLKGDALHFVVVDNLGLGVDAVCNEVIKLAGEVDGGTMSKVSAVVEAHAQNLVAGLDKRLVSSQVGVGAGVRLNVGKAGVEDLLGTLDGKILNDVDLLAAAVVTLCGVALGVLVGKNGTHGLHDGRADDVLGCDQLDLVALAIKLAVDCRRDLGVGLGNVSQSHSSSPFNNSRQSRCPFRRFAEPSHGGPKSLNVRNSTPNKRMSTPTFRRRCTIETQKADKLELVRLSALQYEEIVISVA